ncbi:putative C6 transcription factor [Dothidotthia symphoricarpi CBS 119687]|uniref:Putative C6 transcription factor n=1 Tax=Dothidotthia symphoricarpi CBS 119687 TaxID=1392245 RepID=A0A6A6AJY9_9PLEO|nr:putative C6 transcription factor [Dothidotthia symphoricarpi CBS 119687]KAF2131234.1 putative C6 transcription factor [Dothidotthia symphoricarpi CBS 119687]
MSEVPVSSVSNEFGQQRVVTACLPCRRRKVKCDHAQPVCSACRRGNRACTYASPQLGTPGPLRRTGNGVTRQRPSLRNGQDEIRTRLDRLERLLEQALSKGYERSSPVPGSGTVQDSEDEAHSVGAVPNLTSPQIDHETLSADGYDGALLVGAGAGHSRWVSSLHYALLADQIHDVKMLLGEQTRGNFAADPISLDQASPQFPFSSTTIGDITRWLPGSAEECFSLLEIFISNVDPVTRLVHKPSLKDRFTHYINHVFRLCIYDDHDGSDANISATKFPTFEPLVFAILHSAINSLSPESVLATYNADRDSLLAQFQRGVELGLGRENFVTTSSIEVLQAFVLLLTCQSREDDMARTWTFLGLAVRIALSQGLHREPSLFPSYNMDVVQVELRRRLWHQICHLDYRAAESTGQEPSISDDDFTTLLPSNIDDNNLKQGSHAISETTSVPGFTDMSGHLIRLHGIHCFRDIVKSTYRLERHLKSSMIVRPNTLHPVAEFQAVFIEVRTKINKMKDDFQTQYLAFCNPQISEQRLALGLAVIVEWKCWSILWLRTPREYREAVISPEIRQTVLGSSISLLESINMMPGDKDAKRFQWHIGSHSCFQAIMHIISELDTPAFKSPHHETLRSRALVALQSTVSMRGCVGNPIWNVIDRKISNGLGSTSGLAQSALAVSQKITFQPGTTSDREGDLAAFVQQTSAPASVDANSASNANVFNDLENLDGLYTLDHTVDFDWTFFNVDPTI